MNYLSSGRFLRYSEKNNRLFVDNEQNVMVFNPETSKIDLIIQHPKLEQHHYSEDKIVDMMLIESPLTKVLLLSDSGWLIMDGLEKRSTESSQCVLLEGSIWTEEYKPVISICSSEKYLLIEMAQDGQDYSNYYNLVEIGRNLLIVKLCIELETPKAKPIFSSSLKFAGYFSNNHLIFFQQFKKTGLALDENDKWSSFTEEFPGVFDYNYRTGRMRLINAEDDKVVFDSAAHD